MALFKIYRGQSSDLPATINDGFCYYTYDDNKFYVDANGERKCINDFPTDLADLLSDEDHRTVTDEQIQQWTNAEPNQDAFSNIEVGDVTITADDKSDTVTFIAGTNVTLTPNAAEDTITFSSHDTTYTITAGADGSSFTLTPSVGSPTTITLANTEYTISVSGNNVVLTPSTGQAQTITVPYATTAGTALSMDAANLTGTIDIERIPAAALERVVVVADDTERFALTTDDIQLGDTVKVVETEKMYMVKNEDELGNEDGYEEYSAGNASSVPWAGVTDKPSSYPPSSHTHVMSDVTDLDSMTAEEDGQDLSLVTTGEKYRWNNTHTSGSGVIDGYYYNDKFWEESTHTTEIVGESSKIYLDVVTNNGYRWDGTSFVEITSSVTLDKSINDVDIASFDDGADNIPVKNLNVAIDRVQDLNGYDHPWAGGEGKNLLENQGSDSYTSGGITYTKLPDGRIHCQGTVLSSSSYWINAVDTEYHLPAGRYRISIGDDASVNGITLDGYIRTPGSSTYTTLSNGMSFNITNTQYISSLYIRATTVGDVIDFIVEPMICDADDDTTYEPYSNICPINGFTGAEIVCSPTTDAQDGTTYSIEFPSAVGTVYGGMLDVTTGVLTVDSAYIASYDGETLPGEWISDRDEYVAGTTPSTGAQVVYKIATPTTYQCTPTEVRTLLGDNNIWSDTGEVNNLTYYTSVFPDGMYPTVMTGATASANGTAGYAPAPPSSGYNTKFLRADATWAEAGNVVELTQQQYDALTPAEKNNGTIYMIPDSDEGIFRIIEMTQADYDLLPSSAKNSETVYMITDGEPQAHAEDVFFDNTDSGLASNTVQDAINTVANIFGNSSIIEPTNIASKDYFIGDYLIYENHMYRVIDDILEDDTLVVNTNIEETNLPAEIDRIKNSTLLVDMGTITGSGSSVTTTKTVPGATGDMIVAQSILGTPSAQIGEWTVTTSTNEISVVGVVDGSTTLSLLLVTAKQITAT